MELKEYLIGNREAKDRISSAKSNEWVNLCAYSFHHRKFKKGDVIQNKYTPCIIIKIDEIYPTYNMYGEPTLMYIGVRITVEGQPYKKEVRRAILQEDAILKLV